MIIYLLLINPPEWFGIRKDSSFQHDHGECEPGFRAGK